MRGVRQQATPSSRGNGSGQDSRHSGAWPNRGNNASLAKRRRQQVRAAQHSYEQQITRTIELIDKWGNKETRRQLGQMNKTKHRKILSVLEKRAMRYKCASTESGKDSLEKTQNDNINETGTVDTSGLTGNSSAETERHFKEGRSVQEMELEQVSSVDEYLLEVHGVAPGSKQEGVWRLIYENLNGIWTRLSGNDKLEKARGIIDYMEADIV